MHIYASKDRRGNPVWILNWYVLGKQKRKQFPRNPNVPKEQDKGYLDAEIKREELIRTEGDDKTIESMSSSERASIVQLWAMLKRLEMHPYEAAEIIKAKFSKKIPLAEGVDRFLRELKALERSDRYQRSAKSNLLQFAAAFPGLRVDQITPENIQWWRDFGDFTPASRRSRLTDVKTFFKHATLHKWTAENPCLPVKGPKVIYDLPGILSPRQVAKLMRVAYRIDRKLCAWLALALFCGVRPEELSKLTWENVHLEQRLVEITARASKTGRRRLVTIPENAVKWLKLGGDLATVRPSGCDLRGPVKLMGPINLKERFDRVRRKAGLFKNWPHDAMRHSAATYLLALTENAAYVAKQMGHSGNVLLQNYNSTKTGNGKLVTKLLAEEYFKIEPPAN